MRDTLRNIVRINVNVNKDGPSNAKNIEWMGLYLTCSSKGKYLMFSLQDVFITPGAIHAQ